jgi:hypothetical protein
MHHVNAFIALDDKECYTTRMRTRLPASKEVVKVIERRDTLVRKTCEAPSCGNEFLGLRRQRFCSSTCRARFNYDKHREEYQAEKKARYHAQKKQKAK